MNQTWENSKKSIWSIWLKFGPPFFFFENLAPPVTRYQGQLSSCTISEKTNDSMEDRQTDESDFIRRCPTNVERPINHF